MTDPGAEEKLLRGFDIRQIFKVYDYVMPYNAVTVTTVTVLARKT